MFPSLASSDKSKISENWPSKLASKDVWLDLPNSNFSKSSILLLFLQLNIKKTNEFIVD